jgi:hypothetical protein
LEQWFENLKNSFSTDPLSAETSIVFLPTRGLFAEAMLGHCNACEKRDVTRMWDWTEATFEPLPTLTGLSPGQKGSTVIPDAPQLPGSVLNIQAAPAMPDPSGLVAALSGITQGGIFRDMSGMAEVTSLLKTLSNNASLDQATRQKAAEAAAKIEGASSGGGGGRRMPSARETFDNLTVANEIAKSAGSMGWSPETIAEVTKNRVEGGVQVTPANLTNDLPSMTEIQDALDILRFRDLFTFMVPQTVVSAAEARGFTNQPLPKYGWGPVNFDEYTIRINKLPKDPVSGVVFTEEEFFEYVRKNFPKFLQPFPRTGQPESLAPVSSNDGTSWNSGTPIGSAMLFTIDVPLNPALIAPIVPERALVLCTAYSPTPVQGRRYWNFSTFTGPNPAGYHPVSGTRQWGLVTGNGYWEFYTRAADRLGGFLEWSQSEAVYKGQDLYWKYFQAALQKFVRDNQGEAEVQSDSAFVRHFDWDRVNRQMSLKLMST